MDDVDLARRLGHTPLFSRLPQAALLELLRCSPTRQVRAGDALAHAEGLTDHIVLLAGSLQADRCWTTAEGQLASSRWQVDVQPDGPGFALLSAAGSGIRVRALSDAHFRCVDGDALDDLLGFGHMGGHLARLRHLNAFHEVPLEVMRQLLDCMTEREVAAGETIIQQGQAAEAYYVILAGEAEVWVTDPITDDCRCVTVLGEADGFGEEGLLLEGSCTATVRMISPGRLLVLAQSDFDRLVKPGMVEEIEAAAVRDLLAEGRARLLDCRYEMEFAEGHIPGAQHLPLDRLRREGVFAVEPAPCYVVYCRSGRRSRAAVFLLRERGIHASSLRGGIRDWPFELVRPAA